MNDTLRSRLPQRNKSPRSLRRATYAAVPLLSILSLFACSTDDGGLRDGEELVGEQSAALQLSGTATASSGTAASAVDGNAGTRWESAHGVDPQWITIDLGSQKTFDRVYLSWEAAYATAYKIQQSNDNVTFTDLYTTTTGNGGIDDITGLNGNARYVRMYGTVRATVWGYSLWEMQVHQSAAACLSNDLMTSASLPMTASSGTAAAAADNNTGTRWESAATDPQYVQVDLGSVQKINRVNIAWETASAKDYTVQLSDNGTTWTTLVTKTNMPAGANRVDDLTGLSGTGRYMRINGTARTTGYGYSIWEMTAYGDPNPSCGGSSCTPTTCATLGANCGTASDGCGGTLACGTCSGGQTCNGSNQCVATCTPTTCAALGATCGTPSNGCGGTLSCGTCSGGNTCNTSNQCVAPPPSGGSCVKIRSQRTNNYLFNNAGLVTPGATAAAAEVFEKVASGSNFRFKATSNNTFVGITGDDLAVNGTAADFTEYDCSSAGLYPNGKGYASLTGTGRNWKTNSTTGAVDTNNGGNGGTCVNGGATAWERFYVESATCPGGGSTQPCGGTCTTGQTCNLSNVCVTESCGGGCAMGQKCVSNACVGDLSSSGSYYNSTKTLETIPANFFGPNMKVYKHDSDPTTIANELAAAYAAQRGGTGATPDAQFATRRDTFMFAPGSYAAQLDIGFNTQISGMGDHPDTVNLSGRIMAMPPADMGNNGTQTFWRVLENFKSSWATTNNIWAVSQAAPMRRVHALGEISLHLDWGWQSGGFISDSVFDYKLHYGSQQQFYTRNSHAATAEFGTWNIVYQGVTGTKAQAAFPAGPMTDVANAPVIREKPFLYINRDGLFKVFVPGLRTNAVGPSWTATSGGSGTSIPLSNFLVAREGVDTATTMNNALAAGKHLLLTPGVYYLDAPLAVNNANTVVLGIGMATLTPNNGVNAINIADVDGVKVGGVLIDAGTGNSDTLIQVGPAGSSASHAANPTSLHDIYTRIGGRGWVAKAKKSVVVNSHNVILDHTWLWRADHGAGVGWTLNTAANGLIVNGNDVISYGTHVEHFQEYQVKWNGNNGRNYFFQNELPYEATSQAAYDDPPNPIDQNVGSGYASYKVADNVVNHEFIGGGCYAVFTMNDCTVNSDCSTNVCCSNGNTNAACLNSNSLPINDNKCSAPAGGMNATRCFEAPDAQAGVKFKNMLSLSLTAKGKINNLMNNDGKVAGALEFDNPGAAGCTSTDGTCFPETASWH